jgi:hypothetical protein
LLCSASHSSTFFTVMAFTVTFMTSFHLCFSPACGATVFYAPWMFASTRLVRGLGV